MMKPMLSFPAALFLAIMGIFGLIFLVHQFHLSTQRRKNDGLDSAGPDEFV
jgi:hypothetical protein